MTAGFQRSSGSTCQDTSELITSQQLHFSTGTSFFTVCNCIPQASTSSVSAFHMWQVVASFSRFSFTACEVETCRPSPVFYLPHVQRCKDEGWVVTWPLCGLWAQSPPLSAMFLSYLYAERRLKCFIWTGLPFHRVTMNLYQQPCRHNRGDTTCSHAPAEPLQEHGRRVIRLRCGSVVSVHAGVFLNMKLMSKGSETDMWSPN